MFDVVKESFLLVGHTPEDIFQAFSQTSVHLRCKSAATLFYFYAVLHAVYGGSLFETQTKPIIKWTALCH